MLLRVTFSSQDLAPFGEFYMPSAHTLVDFVRLIARNSLCKSVTSYLSEHVSKGPLHRALLLSLIRLASSKDFRFCYL